MDDLLRPEDLEPLLDVARSDSDADMRIGALDAACRFPLSEPGWREVAAATRSVLDDLTPGTPPRAAALDVAAKIPLLSVRRRLRELADDPGDPDASALASALARVGDPSRAQPLLEELRAGRFEGFEWLAALPVEQAGISFDAIPTAAEISPAEEQGVPNLGLWRALVLARLGEFDAVDAFLAGHEDDPPLFWGDPWSAYGRIAAIRPIPDEMRQRLLDALPGTEQIADAGRQRMARLIIWAATGIADAEGTLLAQPGPQAPSDRAGTAAEGSPDRAAAPDVASTAEGAGGIISPAQAAAARQLKKRLEDPETSSARPVDEDLTVLRCLAPSEVNDLVVTLVQHANKRAQSLAPDAHERQDVGNRVLDIVANLRPDSSWPIAELTEPFLQAQPAALDVGQLAWIIARASPPRVTEVLLPALGRQPAREQRQRALDLIAAVADTQSGRAGSPWRGAGAGGGADGLRIPLIDDDMEMAMAPSEPAPSVAPSRPSAPPPAPPSPPPPSPSPPSPSRSAPSPRFRSAEIPSRPAGQRRSARRGPASGDARGGPAADDAGTSGSAEPGLEHTGTFAAAGSDERRVNALILHQGRLRKTFLAGAEHVIRCWIGLADRSAATADRPIPTVAIPAAGLPLNVQLLWNDQSDSKPLLLPADRTARTGDCDLRIRVPEGERYVSAEIAFLYRGRAFEVVRIEAFAIAAGEDEAPQHEVSVRTQIQRREVVELEDRADYDSLFIWGGESERASGQGSSGAGTNDHGGAPAHTLLEFGAHGAARYSLTNAGRAVQWLNDELFNTDKSLVRRRARQGASNAEPMLDDQDAEVLGMLRQLARHGTALYNQLRGQRLADPGVRVQLLNQSPDEYVPLEFVYDAGYPADDAGLCAGWQDALLGDDDLCPVCTPPAELSDAERDWRPVICPLGFWSLQKIIERLDPQAAKATGIAAPNPTQRTLGALDRIVFAASHRVEEQDRRATSEALKLSVGSVELVDDWNQWKQTLQKVSTPLLLALPHHGIEAMEDYLEIGGDPTPASARRVARGRLTDIYVNPRHDEPGPVVILLGCQTGAVTETGYVSLARSLQQLRTSIVVGTLAKVLGRHAAQVAQELVAQLTTTKDPNADFGSIMRRMRRRMLAKGYLMALCLVALGDADWHLSPGTGSPASGGAAPDLRPASGG